MPRNQISINLTLRIKKTLSGSEKNLLVQFLVHFVQEKKEISKNIFTKKKEEDKSASFDSCWMNDSRRTTTFQPPSERNLAFFSHRSIF